MDHHQGPLQCLLPLYKIKVVVLDSRRERKNGGTLGAILEVERLVM
jgi:hypothetical protein